MCGIAGHIGTEKITEQNLNIYFSKKTSYDICKKSWGFYCLPSINKRLINLNFSTFLVENFMFKKFYKILQKRESKNYLRVK